MIWQRFKSERTLLLQEEIAALDGTQTNRSDLTLKGVTVPALPINIIAGLLGMNIGSIPLADSSHGIPVIALVALTSTVIAGWPSVFGMAAVFSGTVRITCGAATRSTHAGRRLVPRSA